jgi:E3 ubiquitin-protein ligase MYCBP2
MAHEALDDLLKPIVELKTSLTKKALVRARVEGLLKDADAAVASGKHATKEQFCMAKLAYYLCFKCKKPYFGGLKECAGGANADELRAFKVEDLVCGPCSGATEKCDQHGTGNLVIVALIEIYSPPQYQ